MMRLRKAFRSMAKVGRNTQDFGEHHTPISYRIKGDKMIRFPSPTAMTKDGADLDPIRAVQLRVNARHIGAPEEGMPPIHHILTSEFVNLSNIQGQDKEDWRCETLGLEK